MSMRGRSGAASSQPMTPLVKACRGSSFADQSEVTAVENCH